MHEENHHLYLTVTDGRVHNTQDIENLTVTVTSGHPMRLGDVARVERAPEPVLTSLLPDKTSGETHVHVNRFRCPIASWQRE
jgi:Cu/Ag efflux pump CusA